MNPPDRRLAPRPLPAHLASAMLLWLSSRAGLTSLASGLPSWNLGGSAAGENLRALAAEIGRAGTEAVGAALDCEVLARADRFFAGLEAYRRHPFRREEPDAPVVWRQGNARLLDYGKDRGRGVLVVPSLINRYYVLDLLPERSFLRYLAGRGLRPFVLDWGEPGDAERNRTLSDYIAGLEAAMKAAIDLTGGAVGVIGYCMGGLLALALALRCPDETACLALLATPWDFHADRAEPALLLATAVEAVLLGAHDMPLAVEVIQGLFLALDPFLAERKFIRFADLDQTGAAARDFVALEDWINDGVPLARKVALECAGSWYRDNDPARGEWQVAGQPVRPAEVAMPSLVVLPSRDRIVPPLSAEPLATAIPGATMLRPPFGHIGMMASATAPETVWRPIADWLQAHVG